MERELTRTLGVSGIVLMVVAAAAPITVVVANFPIILMSAESVGAPLMVLAATVILLLFSVGYTWMTPHVPDAGAFYAYVIGAWADAPDWAPPRSPCCPTCC